MTDMIERARLAAYEWFCADHSDDPRNDENNPLHWEGWAAGHVSRAALLAALDLSEDGETFKALVTAIAIADDGHPDGLKYRELAKAALLSLHACASQ